MGDASLAKTSTGAGSSARVVVNNYRAASISMSVNRCTQWNVVL
ncbi:MAG: hypothetical protein WCI74_16050 [Actinomycetes bacterium]